MSRPETPPGVTGFEGVGPGDGGGADADLGDGATKACPYCAETIRVAAIKCRWCQSDLTAAAAPGAAPAAAPSAKSRVRRRSPRPARTAARATGSGTAQAAGTPEAEAGTATAGRPSTSRARLTGRPRAVLLAVVALSLVVTLVLGALAVLAWRDAFEREASGEAGRAARATVPGHLERLLSYDYTTFEEDLDAASALMTDSFAEEYLPTVETIRDRALEQERTQEATVVAVSVVSETPDEVETLVFLNRTTYTADSPRQRILQDRANVTVVRDGDGEWLIDDITFPTA
ncbi:hypothetical protein [Nocardioides sp. HDW12B]|uniref:hypothetical protein n=1 Tax=Nocardioides sp. HDW12B TaxID=2714939 RepID=UPI00197D3429|nr:hypothetical protein [Nocardioides sp. HDW12B]